MSIYKLQADQAGISTVLAAVALQDHIVRNLQLDSTQSSTFSISSHTSNRATVTASRIKSQKSNEQKYNTGRKNSYKSLATKRNLENADDEGEYVLDKLQANQSLAEKLGLVEVRDRSLSESEWKIVKDRATDRLDFRLPCVICKEDLGITEHVLLSCSHVFHKSCLNAFERFIGRKTCPMCRREQYQTRLVHDGKAYYKNKCATRIQAAWRGYVVRCMYNDIRKHHPPSDAKLRKRYYEQKLTAITDRLVGTCGCDVDSFISELDRELEASRKMSEKFDDITRQISEAEWRSIIALVLERDCSDCSICLMPLLKWSMCNQSKAAEGCVVYNKSIPNKVFSQDTTRKPPVRNQDRTHSRIKFRVSSLQNSNPVSSKSSEKAGRTKSTCTHFNISNNLSQKTPAFATRSVDLNRLKHNIIYTDPTARNTETKSDKHSPCLINSQSLRHRDSAYKQRVLVVLSCSHVLHHQCLQALEEFASEEMRFVCPICRSVYQKRIIEPEDILSLQSSSVPPVD